MRLPDATGAWGKRPETEAGRIARLASIASDGSASARPVVPAQAIETAGVNCGLTEYQ